MLTEKVKRYIEDWTREYYARRAEVEQLRSAVILLNQQVKALMEYLKVKAEIIPATGEKVEIKPIQGVSK